MALKFFEIKDRISGDVYTHSNPNKNLLIKIYLPKFTRNGEYEQVRHDLIRLGFNIFMPEKTNSYCFLQERGKFIPTPSQIDELNRISNKWEVINEEKLTNMGFEFIP